MQYKTVKNDENNNSEKQCVGRALAGARRRDVHLHGCTRREIARDRRHFPRAAAHLHVHRHACWAQVAYPHRIPKGERTEAQEAQLMELLELVGIGYLVERWQKGMEVGESGAISREES